jgi:cell division protein YceG involved in septum cleavage
VVVASTLLSGVIYYVLLSPPEDFETGGYVRIAKGSTIPDTAQYLFDRSFIRSRTVFKILMRSPLADNKMVAGDYLFDKPLSTISITKRLANGDFNLKQFKVTIPEGGNC